MTAELVYLIVETVAIVTSAWSGVVLAGRLRFDGFGVFVLAFMSSVGGGTMRDIFLNIRPFWMTDSHYIVLIFISSIVGQFSVRSMRGKIPRWIMPTLDAAGLSLFVIIGIMKSLNHGVDWPVALVMGIVTGVGGGLVRDVVIGVCPYVFRGELYAIVAVIAGALFLFGLHIGLTEYQAGAISGGVSFPLRMFAWKYGWTLPILDLPPLDDEDVLTTVRSAFIPGQANMPYTEVLEQARTKEALDNQMIASAAEGIDMSVEGCPRVNPDEN